MNPAILGGILRALLTAAAGFLAGKGIDITGFLGADVQAAIVLVLTTGWSVWAKRAPKP